MIFFFNDTATTEIYTRSLHDALPIYPGDALVVICSELPNNPGGSITNSADVIAAGVIQANELPTPLVWIEHWPKESTNGGEETFELVVFSSYEVVESALPGRDTGMDGRRYMEAVGPYHCGGLSGRQGVEG